MATGVDFSRTLEGGHEPFYDFPCSLCQEQGKHVEAAKYCEECVVFMCDTCLSSIHNRIPLNTRHTFLDQGLFLTLSQSANKSFSTKRCSKHPGELINIFCGNHDVVCCSVCKADTHSNCAKTQHLPDAAKGIQASKEYQNIKKETQEFLSDLNKVLTNRQADINRIAVEKQHVKETIADFRKKVKKYFDDLEQKCLTELDLRETSIVKRLEEDRKFLDKTRIKAEDILKKLHAFGGDNECELFCQVKTGRSFVRHSIQKVKDISLTERESIVLTIDAEIEKYLSSVVSLGSFIDTHATAARSLSVLSTNGSSIRSPAVPSNSKVITLCVSPQVLHDHSEHTEKYETKLFGKFNVKEKSDTAVLDIIDICQLPDGNILIIDFNNRKLKRIDMSYTLIDSVQLPGAPARVCAAGLGKAVVSLFKDKKVQLVSVGRKLTLTSSFRTGSYCRGIVYIDDKLYVCCGDYFDISSGYIEVYNKAGQLQHFLPRASQRLPVVPKNITVSDDGQHFFLTSFCSDNISMLDLTGNVVKTFSSKELRNPNGICTDADGQLFVCGQDSNTIVQFSPKHQMCDVILSDADGVLQPRGVYCDMIMSRLLVACYGSNTLLAYTCSLK